MHTYHHFIGGKIQESSSAREFDVYNPAVGTVIAKTRLATDDEVNHAIAVASAAFPGWRDTTPLKRSRVLFKFKALLEDHIDELAIMISREHGKVIDDAKGEVMRGVELVEFMCSAPSLLKGSYSQDVGPGIDCFTIRQPLGVCGGVTPFNFPVMVSVWQFTSAIACGNTFVLKPSEKVPAAPMFMAELLKKAGLPDGVFNVVNGDKTAVDCMLAHPDVKTMACVGSTPVAEYIYKTAINNDKRSHAFGGAKNHAILMPDADIDMAANAILGASFGAAGERCMALPVVVAVGDAVADALVAQLKAALPSLKVGPGNKAGVEMGPLITREHLARVKSYVDIGVSEGASLVHDGRDLTVKGHEDGFFMGPCLFDHVTEGMRVYKEEIFGPVLCVLRAPDFETALRLVNEHEFGNGTAVFTRDGDVAREFAARVQVGMVGINIPIPVPISYHSFGGWKHSVFGDVAMHGGESIRFYTKPKSVTTKWPTGVRTNSEFIMPTHD
jgi:malonate-semialdehyde dehydrogenase (acetylating) / methylmalonate-semialdehyde dehydrogenase